MSPGSPSRPSAGSRPGRALRRKALDDAADGHGSEPDGVDVPRSVVDPRAVRFREALAHIPDLEHDEGPPDEPAAPPTSTSQQIIDLDAIPAEPRLPNTAEVDLAERLKKVPDGTPLPAVRTRLSRPSRSRTTVAGDPQEPPQDDGMKSPDLAEDRAVIDLGPIPTAESSTPSPASHESDEIEILDGDEPVDEVGGTLDLEDSDPDAELDLDLEVRGEPVDDDLLSPDDDLFESVGPEVAAVPTSEPVVASARTRTRAKHSKPKVKERRTATSARPKPPWWRRAGFALTLAALVAAVPVLFVAGYRTITRSTDGNLNTSSLTREDPGFEELVTSTPTAVLTQLDADGVPVGLTLLSLSNGDGGGAVVFIPLDTQLAEPAFGVSTLRTVVTMSQRPPAEVRGGIVPQIAKLVNVQIDETFELDDAGWTQMVAPVGAVDIHNPDQVDVLGVPVDVGPVTLQPDQVGGYLAAMRWGETQLNQFVRQEAVWEAWLAKVATSPDAEVVPGEADSGIGRFIRTLAAGPVTFLTLPGDFGADGDYHADEAAVRDMVVDHIPVPAPPRSGARVTVRLLNGVEPADPSPELIRQIVANRGSISVIGNATSFDDGASEIVYADPEMEMTAGYMATVLGIDAEPRFDPTAGDAVDLTIIVGRDLHDPSGGS